jgi:hypothetical protein
MNVNSNAQQRSQMKNNWQSEFVEGFFRDWIFLKKDAE